MINICRAAGRIDWLGCGIVNVMLLLILDILIRPWIMVKKIHGEAMIVSFTDEQRLDLH